MIEMLRRVFESEWKRLIFFCLIGGTCLGLNIALYALFSRILFRRVDHTVLNTITVILVSFLNYELNRHFTFDKQSRDLHSITRFTLVVITATVLNSTFFWLLHAVFGFVDLFVIPVNALLIAFFTFSMHRMFTFRRSARDL